MTELNSILDQLPEPRMTRLGDFVARLLKPAQNAGLSFIVDPNFRTGILNEPPESIESSLRGVIARLPGFEGEHLRNYFAVHPRLDGQIDEAGLPASSEAVEAVVGYATLTASAAVEHHRPISAEDLLSSQTVTQLEEGLRQSSIRDIPRPDLDEASRYLAALLVEQLKAQELL